MTYIDRINAFWTWVQYNEIGSNGAILYLAMLHCANRAAWPKFVSIPNRVLLSLTGLSMDTLKAQRNKLVQLGAIDYAKGKKGKAALYSFPELGVNFDSFCELGGNFLPNNPPNITPNSTPNNPPNSTPNTPHLYRQRQRIRQRQDKDIIIPPIPPTENPAELDQDMAEVFRAWDRASGRCMTMAEGDSLLALYDQYGKERLLYGINQCVSASVVKLNYLTAVLEGRGKKAATKDGGNSKRREKAVQELENDPIIIALEREMLRG